MTKREIMIALLKHKEYKRTPFWLNGFTTKEMAEGYLGAENVPDDFVFCSEYQKGAPTEENQIKKIRYAEKSGSYAIAVGRNSNLAYGRGGPGVFLERIIEDQKDYYVTECETGIKTKYYKEPYSYGRSNYPLTTLDEIDDLKLPDPNEEERYRGIEAEVDFLKKKGYFVYANTNGILSGLYNYLYPFQDLMINLVENKAGVHKAINKVKEFNLTVARNFLERGVDCIGFCDDLGFATSLFFSRNMFKEFFLPFYREVADLCHQYDGFVHMHSHGNLLKVMDLLEDINIDILNPCLSEEQMDVEYLLNNYGQKMAFAGGISSSKLKDLTDAEIEDEIKGLVAKLRDKPYIMMAGFSQEMPQEKFDLIIDNIKKLSG